MLHAIRGELGVIAILLDLDVALDNLHGSRGWCGAAAWVGRPSWFDLWEESTVSIACYWLTSLWSNPGISQIKPFYIRPYIVTDEGSICRILRLQPEIDLTFLDGEFVPL